MSEDKPAGAKRSKEKLSETKPTPWWRRKKWLAVWGLLLLVAARLTILAPRDVDIIVGYNTTRVTGPLREDGTIDYVAAINEQYSEGVTKDNNAAVLLLQAIDPSDLLPGETRDRVLDALDVPPAAKDTTYFIGLKAYVRTHGSKADVDATIGYTPSRRRDPRLRRSRGLPRKIPSSTPAAPKGVDWTKRFEELYCRSWSAEEAPFIANWLDANEGALNLIEEATRRPRYYMPLFSTEDPPTVLDVRFTSLGVYRAAAKALSARAMLKLGRGDSEGAWGDVMTVHRLARIIGQDPLLISRLAAMGIDELACLCSFEIVRDGSLSAQTARTHLVQLQGLPPVPTIVDVIDRFERFYVLDIIVDAKREGSLYKVYSGGLEPPSFWESMGDWVEYSIERVLARQGPQEGCDEASLSFMHWMSLDWNLMLEHFNVHYDAIVVASRACPGVLTTAPGPSCEHAATISPTGVLLRRLAGRAFQKELSRHAAEMLGRVVLPSVSRLSELKNRTVMRFELMKLAWALAAFRAEKGSYPAELDELEGDYLPEIPQDIFSGRPLVYQRTEDSYLLYSVGIDGDDDGGVGGGKQGADDIVVRVEVGPVKQ